MYNIVCNLIYNDGGEGDYVGFNGRCSIQNIIYNVKKTSKRWCNQPDCSCKKYYDRSFKGKVEDFPCHESRIFKDWLFSPGSVFETKRPFKMRHAMPGKVAILTTCFANTSEAERKIIGFFRVNKVIEEKHTIVSSKRFKLRLLFEEANELNFWQYYRNRNSKIPEWKQGRFRYIEDFQVAAVLHDLLRVVQNENTQSMIAEMLRVDFPNFANTRPKVVGAIKGDYVDKIWNKRKYGPGGESRSHKMLKEYIANNADEIGLIKSEVKAKVEHSYISGDIVDILFEPIKGLVNTVVEIELDNVLPGIHQAIKYRVLRCSQLNIPLNSQCVNAVVVAWKFTEEEKNLCNRYNIKYYKKRI